MGSIAVTVDISFPFFKLNFQPVENRSEGWFKAIKNTKDWINGKVESWKKKANDNLGQVSKITDQLFDTATQAPDIPQPCWLQMLLHLSQLSFTIGITAIGNLETTYYTSYEVIAKSVVAL